MQHKVTCLHVGQQRDRTTRNHRRTPCLCITGCRLFMILILAFATSCDVSLS